MKVKYKCKENDVELIFFIDNNEIEEVLERHTIPTEAKNLNA